ncbi:MAG: VWA domain-containing protein [Bacteroidales bacterium]|nr:VWA domain-containing protein [Bacteroidales bacterium]
MRRRKKMLGIHDLQFEHPWVLFLILGIPLLAWWLHRTRDKKKTAIHLPSFSNGFKKSYFSLREFLHGSIIYIRLASIALILIALARPITFLFEEKVKVEGIDIILINDISGSMLAEDLKPNRLEAAKNVAIEFIRNRKNDRIGMVAFSGGAYTVCPLTTDHRMLIELVKNLEYGMIEDGTAIGDGLALAVDRIKDSEAKSKVAILLTDGINNRGFISPLFASQIAKQYGIRLYTIGVGTTKGKAPYPYYVGNKKYYDYVDVQIDEPMLKEMAIMTGGRYFRATDNNSLENIYKEIDKMEKTLFEATSMTHQTELFPYPLVVAILLLALEFFIKHVIIKPLP